MKRLIGLLFVMAHLASAAKADSVAALIQSKRVAVTVSPVRLFADSSYAKSTETTFTEGTLFEVVGETVREHYDNTQNQTFKWYKVRAANGQLGWIFGDNLAVVLPEQFVDLPLRPFYKKTARFDNGFENAIVWVAGTQGHDDKYKEKPFLNPPYKEFYIVITNEQGKSVTLNYANVTETGKRDIQSIYFQDVTENNTDEIILETTALPSGATNEERTLEIYSFKAGTLSKIFEERLTLTWEEDVPSPAFSKFVDIEGPILRVAYVDFLPCGKYKQGLQTDIRSRTQERCLEYVTYSYLWDKLEKRFKPLYAESRSVVTATATHALSLKETPSVSAASTVTIQPNERLQVVKHYDNVKVEKGVKKIDNWLYVRHPSGIYGYLPATEVQFKNLEHAAILQRYYEKTPLMKQDWLVESPFLSVKK